MADEGDFRPADDFPAATDGNTQPDGDAKAEGDDKAASSTEPAAPVRRAALDIRPTEGRLPDNQAQQMLADEQAGASDQLTQPWSPINYRWKAAAVSHRPLYFQDASLERYGHHHGIFEPAISAAKFFGRIPVMPYLVGATPCDECEYALGYFRPGDCVPLHHTHPKPSLRGAAYQALATTGAILVIP